MNVLYIPSWFPSGENHSGVFFREWAEAIAELSETRLAVCLFGNSELRLRDPWGSFRSILDSIGSPEPLGSIPVFRANVLRHSHRFGFPDRRYLRAGRKNLTAAQKAIGRIDLIHALVTYPAGFVAMHLARELDIPYVITEVMGPFPFPQYLEGGGLSARIRDPLQNADAVMAISPSLQKTMASYGIDRVVSVPGFVDERAFSPNPQHRRGNPFVFFSLSNLSFDKGTDDLLEAVRILVHEHKRSDVVFRIGGPGDVAAYGRIAKEKGVAEFVSFLGPLSRERTAGEFQNADGFALLSRHETFGIVYIEAMACGLPVLAAKSGGPESIVDDTNGVLVDVGDHRQIAGGLLHLLDNRAEYDSTFIRETFMKRFSRAAVVERLVSVYRGAVEAHANRKRTDGIR